MDVKSRLFNEDNAMNMYKQMAVIVVAAMCAGVTTSARTADFSLATPNMAFEIDGDASNARFDFPRNTVRDKDFWRLILDDGARTEIPVFSHAQKDLNPHSEQFPALFRYTFLTDASRCSTRRRFRPASSAASS